MKYTLNHNFFDTIDSEEKAYFLGLLFADGCVQNKGNSWRIRIGLQSKDHDLIQLFKDTIQYDGLLKITENRTTLDFSSKVVGEALFSHGCIPRKSLVLTYPATVNKELEWHFIRGYFDGDGCLCISGRGARWTLVGTRSFLENVAEVLKSIDVNCTIWDQKRVSILSVSGNKQIAVLLERLYLDSKVSMDRKHEKKIAFGKLMSMIRPIRSREGTIDQQDVIADYQAGMKIMDIESKHQISNKTMYKILKQNNVEKRQVSYSAD